METFKIDADPTQEAMLYQPSGGWPSPTATKLPYRPNFLAKHIEDRIAVGIIVAPDDALIRSQDIKRGWAALGIAAAGLVLFGFSFYWGFFT